MLTLVYTANLLKIDYRKAAGYSEPAINIGRVAPPPTRRNAIGGCKSPFTTCRKWGLSGARSCERKNVATKILY